MRVELTDDQLALQQELRGYFSNLMTAEVQAKIRHTETEPNEDYKALIRQIGSDGWLGVGWPVEYGGRGFTPIEQYIFFNEAWAAQVPVPFLTINTVGPTIREYGTDRQKDFFLKKILAGEMHFSIGYSEPTAGTDLAALKTRAERDGDEWIINGQKQFTSLVYDADYVWLAARTDPDAPAPQGHHHVPGAHRRSRLRHPAVHHNGRLPHHLHVLRQRAGARLAAGGRGERGLGPHHQPAQPRAGVAVRLGGIANLVNQAVEWAKEAKLPDGRRVIDQEWVQVKLAECRARVEFLDLLNWKVAHESTVGNNVNPALASTIKVWGSESMHLVYSGLTEVVGATGHLKKGSPHAEFSSRMEESYRGCWVLTFGGGTNEIQRDIIGMAGLGLPREKRRK